VLEANNAPVLRVAQVLWACLPNIISVPLNSSGSENAIRAAVANLVKAMQRANAIPVPSDDGAAWLEERERRDEAALIKVIERGTVSGSTIRGTQRGRMLQKIERLDDLAREVAELKAALGRSEAQNKAFRAEKKFDRHEIADLKAALLAGTGTECEDDIGILGGMFICTSKAQPDCTLSTYLTQQNPPTYHAIAHTDDPEKERSVLGRGAFGTVYAMVNPHDHQVYAVKELTNLTLEDGSTDEAAMLELLAEVRKMGVVESQFVVQYHTSAVYGGRFYVMMEHIASVHLCHRCCTRVM